MQTYTPRHAAPGALRATWKRFFTWTAQPMNEAASILCGALMGLFMGPILFLCYFG